MALSKVRALHPDIFSDDDVSEVSIPARWLFAGLWCFACDNGHLHDKPKQIKRWIYATDDENVAELLRELETVGLIERADGWIFVPGLKKRQRIDWRYFKICERDDCDKPERAKKDDSQPETRRGNAEPRRANAEALRGHATDGDGDGDGDKNTGRAPRSIVTPDYFDDFWAAYPRKESKGHARPAFAKAAKKEDARVIIEAAMAFGKRVAGSDSKFIAHPTTWLNGERWTDEALEAPVDDGWRSPWVPPIAPPEIADDPELYEVWITEQRKAAGR